MSKYRLLTYVALQSWWIAGWMVLFFFTPAILGLSELSSTRMTLVFATPVVLALIGHFTWDARKLTKPRAVAVTPKAEVSVVRQFLQGLSYIFFGLVLFIFLLIAMDYMGVGSDNFFLLTLLALTIFPPLARSGTVERRAADVAAESAQPVVSAPVAASQGPVSAPPPQPQVVPGKGLRLRITHASLQCWWSFGLLLCIDASTNVPAWLQGFIKDTWYVELLMAALAGAGYWIWRMRGHAAMGAPETRSTGYWDYQMKNFQSFGGWRWGFIGALGIASVVLDSILALPWRVAVIVLLPLALIPPWLFARVWP